uniref:Uncharacterized protein n=1 Tax=Marophrys sp. SRT127 TaxID=2488311 RepID=A0A455REB4_9EUKA|nr:hypothetical protein [Marophrys sp. SRT127]
MPPYPLVAAVDPERPNIWGTRAIVPLGFNAPDPMRGGPEGILQSTFLLMRVLMMGKIIFYTIFLFILGISLIPRKFLKFAAGNFQNLCVQVFPRFRRPQGMRRINTRLPSARILRFWSWNRNVPVAGSAAGLILADPQYAAEEPCSPSASRLNQWRRKPKNKLRFGLNENLCGRAVSSNHALPPERFQVYRKDIQKRQGYAFLQDSPPPSKVSADAGSGGTMVTPAHKSTLSVSRWSMQCVFAGIPIWSWNCLSSCPKGVRA